MKKVILAACLSVLSTAAVAASSGNNGSSKGAVQTFLSGNGYRNLPEASRTYYVMGMLDSLRAVEQEINPAIYDRLTQCTGGWPGNQARAIFDKYLEEHPERWDFVVATLYADALNRVCATSGHPLDR